MNKVSIIIITIFIIIIIIIVIIIVIIIIIIIYRLSSVYIVLLYVSEATFSSQRHSNACLTTIE